jgi:hypothetical protein
MVWLEALLAIVLSVAASGGTGALVAASVAPSSATPQPRAERSSAGDQGPRNATAQLHVGGLTEQPPPPAPRRRGLRQGGASGGPPRCTAETIGPRSDAVTGECCDEPAEDCSSGQPAGCNAGCARVLLPYYDDCRPLLAKMRIAGVLAAVAKLCHAALAAAAAPAPLTTSYATNFSAIDPSMWATDAGCFSCKAPKDPETVFECTNNTAGALRAGSIAGGAGLTIVTTRRSKQPWAVEPSRRRLHVVSFIRSSPYNVYTSRQVASG